MGTAIPIAIAHKGRRTHTPLEARCTQFVNPKYSYVCKVPKRLLRQQAT